MTEKLLARVQKVIIEKVSPSLHVHGGDIELVSLAKTKSGYDLKVILKGACEGCGAAPITLQYLVQETIDENFPDEQIDIIPIFEEQSAQEAVDNLL